MTSDARMPFYAILGRCAFRQHRHAMWLLELAKMYPETARSRRMDAEAVKAQAWANILEAKISKRRAQEDRAA
jgi:hypothetical protein